MASADPTKFRSPFRSVDIFLLRQLCEFHPWSLVNICSHIGLEKSVLSNVLAGRRPLPTRLAKQFLNFVGMMADGALDLSHCFVFEQRPGREEELADLIHRLLPHGGAQVGLSTEWINHGKAYNTHPNYGLALWDGVATVVLQFSHGVSDESVKLRGAWEHFSFDNGAEALLSSTTLPTRSEVLNVFAAADFVQPVQWEDVQVFARERGLSPTHVLDALKRLAVDSG